MKRVAEIIYIVPEKRQEFLQHCLNPSVEHQQILWMHGVRNQYYFQLNDLILMTFEYVGKTFREDMDIVASYMKSQGYLVEKRRKEVPEEERAITNWWAPLLRLGSVLEKDPMPDDEEEGLSLEEQYHEMLNGCMNENTTRYDTAYDEDDWSESIHI